MSPWIHLRRLGYIEVALDTLLLPWLHFFYSVHTFVATGYTVVELEIHLCRPGYTDTLMSPRIHLCRLDYTYVALDTLVTLDTLLRP